MYSRTFKSSIPRTLDSASMVSSDFGLLLLVDIIEWSSDWGRLKPQASRPPPFQSRRFQQFYSSMMVDKEGRILLANQNGNRIAGTASSDHFSEGSIGFNDQIHPHPHDYSTDTTLMMSPVMSSSVNSSVSLSTPQRKTTGEFNISSGVRRSIRPKPASEALISTPPAIKFYESTIIRTKSTTAKPLKLKMNSSKAANSLVDSKTSEINEKDASASSNSKILKLRLSSSDSSINSSSKENNNNISITSSGSSEKKK